MIKKTVSNNSEFGIELVVVTPYVYWLHLHGMLDKVETCKGMQPFYYFAENVDEVYNGRTVSNDILKTNPNYWLHHNTFAMFGRDYAELNDKEKEAANGVLDYRQWTPPPYREFYERVPLEGFDTTKKYVVVSNRYNIEHDESPTGFLSIDCLRQIFDYLASKGYIVIYKRPKNTEFPLDAMEVSTIQRALSLEENGLTDFDLCHQYSEVILFDDLWEQYQSTYNMTQLLVFSKVDGFISIAGGPGILSSYFGVKNVIYVTTGKERRPGYFDENSYYRKLSGCEIHPVVDNKDDIKKRGYNDYTQLIEKIKQVY